jgi:hypothetical protein
MREDGSQCSWEAEGYITRFVNVVGIEATLEDTTVVHTSEDLKATSSHAGNCNDCSAQYESELADIRSKLVKSLQRTITADLPAVESVIRRLRGVKSLAGPM